MAAGTSKAVDSRGFMLCLTVMLSKGKIGISKERFPQRFAFIDLGYDSADNDQKRTH